MLLAVKLGSNLLSQIFLFLLIKASKTEDSIFFWIFFCLLFQIGEEIKDLFPLLEKKIPFVH